ncbi:complex I assembly factor TIMMDC1, mitochondrial isoform X1 [Xenopus laevis]|uniref:Complex I assembly factor TIMMDC1, mitochondrial n=3 Tax=Xenopus laevis TaxID=8355 RepID=TIDC1_XENLA|nr:complex I assembly factor TIMMDC1, mitochondrial [Xenopus laevis]XP_018100708.1 complex I assembly factor TIMMDC1, mitochondrial isoform X1 [Xenopus laevis]XP_018100709.1 complex I assembly factor TIMMDC1, mitochondrial isoform X1 [Xenopus laevis]XP_018100710.1 complex I assembly factor TIMMDC1, mitochondrial isoform X1 [Xenopus laevis]XP_041436981.1 complex I assembly factor TIMMDC1, mitochondrial isoform X1 [Xenopus laevis]Q5XK94.1 RecName: Full=Complex I assembly factor TIMMDC1, mitochon
MAQSDPPKSPDPPLPTSIRNPQTPESGWDRIRELFQPNEQGHYPEEVGSIVKSAVTGALLGGIYGGLPAARHSKERYIQQSQAQIYQHRVEAVRSAHNAALRGFIRYGWRWGWRVAAFVTIFNSVSTGLTVYRDKLALSHYAAAGAVTGGLFRLNLGLVGLLSGSLIGAALGVPAGALISGLQSISGESIREKKRRERQELYENKVQEWSARLQVTDEVLEEMETSQQDPLEQQVEKIQELLQLPRNPAVSPKEGR